MKSVGTKFFLLAGCVIFLFSALLLYRTYVISDRLVNRIIEQQADLALNFDMAITKYVIEKIRPVMFRFVGPDDFIPETMSGSFVARAIFSEVQKKFPDFVFKFSSDNPRNPLNKALPAEVEKLRYFKAFHVECMLADAFSCV